MSELRDILIGTPPKVVTGDTQPLCSRLEKANVSGDIKDMGGPVNTFTLDFSPSPVSVEYDCPFTEECPVTNSLPGLLPKCSLVLNQIIDHEKGGFIPNAYELPPAAESVFACNSLKKVQELSQNNEVTAGQQG